MSAPVVLVDDQHQAFAAVEHRAKPSPLVRRQLVLGGRQFDTRRSEDVALLRRPRRREIRTRGCQIPPEDLIGRLGDVAWVACDGHMARFGNGGSVRDRPRRLVDQRVEFDLVDALATAIGEPSQRGRQRRSLRIGGAEHGALLADPGGCQSRRQPLHDARRPQTQCPRRCALARVVSRWRRPELDLVGLVGVDRGHCLLPRRSADARLRRHRFRQSPANAPRQRIDRVNQELQQPVRIQRLPDQREGELQHLARGAKRRVVLETGPGQADPRKRIVEDDPVPAGHDDGTRRIAELGAASPPWPARSRPERTPERRPANRPRRAVSPDCWSAAPEACRDPSPKAHDPYLQAWRGTIETFEHTPPHDRQVIGGYREARLRQPACAVGPAGRGRYATAGRRRAAPARRPRPPPPPMFPPGDRRLGQ